MNPQVFVCQGCSKLKPMSDSVKLMQVQYMPEQSWTQANPRGSLQPSINWIQVSIPLLLCTLCTPIGLEV